MKQENTNPERDNFQFRVTKEEKKVYNENAKEAGMSATDYFKWLAFGKQPRRRTATPIRKTLIKILAETGKIKSNVEQIRNAVVAKDHYSSHVKTIIVQTSGRISSLADGIQNMLQSGHKMPKEASPVLSELLTELTNAGIDCNKIARVMNDKSYYSVMIKEAVIIQVMNRISLLYPNILNALQDGNEGQNSGERSTTGDLPVKEK